MRSSPAIPDFKTFVLDSIILCKGSKGTIQKYHVILKKNILKKNIQNKAPPDICLVITYSSLFNPIKKGLILLQCDLFIREALIFIY